MKNYYRGPQVEPGIHNIILQNRCGNRLSALVFEDRTELELVYKPNAFRRKDLRARTFSTRDVLTLAMPSILLPEITAERIERFDYDPFLTRLNVRADSGARNCISLLNVADANCFALSAPAPLLLAFCPHKQFQTSDGLVWESFEDRGETITSFVMFAGYEPNRFRVLDDGTHVLQLLEDDVVLIGAEESIPYVDRVADALAGLDLDQLIDRNEAIIANPLSKSAMSLADDDELAEVLDVNRRLVWSGLDAGGACFGAMNRIYHLTWVRDGSMAAATLARAGWTDPVRTWTPFLMANPSRRKDEAGNVVREYLQLVGTRWSKSEDDGIYYAVLSLFDYYRATGEGDLVTEFLPGLLEILDHTIDDRFDDPPGLFGSDTLGEDPTEASPYFGYDVVNGSMQKHRHDASGEKPIQRVYSLYQSVNMYNCLRMAQVLIDALDADDPADRRPRYGQLADDLAQRIDADFVNEHGQYKALKFVYEDGSQEWREFSSGSDCWEYAWAVSAGPFFPDPVKALASSRLAVEKWPTIRSYGYCPWNFLARMLKEHGLDSAGYRQLLDQQIREARMKTDKYPMAPLVTEYQGAVESWRGLPFGIGSLVMSVGSLLIQPLAQGIAARASALVDRIDRFCYKTARIDARAAGQGEVVTEAILNDRPLAGSLQIPESLLRTGRNRLEIRRGQRFDGVRLYASDAALLAVSTDADKLRFELTSPMEIQAIFDGQLDSTQIDALGPDGQPVDVQCGEMTPGRTLVRIGGAGCRSVTVSR